MIIGYISTAYVEFDVQTFLGYEVWGGIFIIIVGSQNGNSDLEFVYDSKVAQSLKKLHRKMIIISLVILWELAAVVSSPSSF